MLNSRKANKINTKTTTPYCIQRKPLLPNLFISIKTPATQYDTDSKMKRTIILT